MSSSLFTTHRRPVKSSNDQKISSGPVRPAVDQAPNPRPISQFLAFGFIIFLGLLQFLPATHFRDPLDPFRKWVPFNSNVSTMFTQSRASSHEDTGYATAPGRENGIVHIVSWMDCLDLRMLAVLANSTLSSSRFVSHH
ncbi:unnamed protein product [Ilex paraguariensis]|uniref:Uncharacterized protein n=1 Tax=Ilex paraguariensis TaxID=185542 RepID=A0ABC8S3P8_9AQUA